MKTISGRTIITPDIVFAYCIRFAIHSVSVWWWI